MSEQPPPDAGLLDCIDCDHPTGYQCTLQRIRGYDRDEVRSRLTDAFQKAEIANSQRAVNRVCLSPVQLQPELKICGKPGEYSDGLDGHYCPAHFEALGKEVKQRIASQERSHETLLNRLLSARSHHQRPELLAYLQGLFFYHVIADPELGLRALGGPLRGNEAEWQNSTEVDYLTVISRADHFHSPPMMCVSEYLQCLLEAGLITDDDLEWSRAVVVEAERSFNAVLNEKLHGLMLQIARESIAYGLDEPAAALMRQELLELTEILDEDSMFLDAQDSAAPDQNALNPAEMLLQYEEIYAKCKTIRHSHKANYEIYCRSTRSPSREEWHKMWEQLGGIQYAGEAVELLRDFSDVSDYSNREIALRQLGRELNKAPGYVEKLLTEARRRLRRVPAST